MSSRWTFSCGNSSRRGSRRATGSRRWSARAGNLIFADNATAAMNVVADALPLAAGDEVLLTDHEYGAVLRIW